MKEKKITKAALLKKERINKRKALQNWSKLVRDRDGNKCVVCGNCERIQAHHILEKRYYPEIKFDINVGISLCPHCHLFSKFSFHKNGIWSFIWLQKNRPNQLEWILQQL